MREQGVVEWPREGCGNFVAVERTEGGYLPLSHGAVALEAGKALFIGPRFLTRREAVQAVHDFIVWGC